MLEIRPYQESISTEAAKLLQWAGLCYLSMEVRTGKTLTALVASGKFGASHVLFVTKKKAIQSITEDYNKLAPSFTLDVINYEQLHNYRGNPDLVIVDEAHSLGAFPKPSVRTKALKEICKGKPVILLSGTVTPESYSQIYHQLWISDRSPFKDYTNFYKWAAEFVWIKKKYFYNRESNDYSNAKKEKIDECVRHLFLSYTQQDAGFEQFVEEEVIKIKMKPGTYWLADKLRKDRVHIGKDGQEIVADTEVKLMQKLHQIYSGTVIDEKGAWIGFDRSKANFIKHHFAGKKIAIFYKFKAEYGAIVSEFGAKNITEIPEEFNRRGDLVFISQVQSGREGINLSTADSLIMYNIDFSSVSYQQAKARIQSKDRTKPCKLYWIFSHDGIEDKIYKAVIEKQDYTISWFRKDFPSVVVAQRDNEVGATICT